MTFTSFVLILVALYFIYYVVMIVWDKIRLDKKKNSTEDSYTPIKIDLGVQSADEVYITETEEPETLEETEEPETPEEPEETETPEEPEETETPEEPEETELFNVTLHGGYSTSSFKDLLKTINTSGENPLECITSRMI